jgi:hypothetical protein
MTIGFEMTATYGIITAHKNVGCFRPTNLTCAKAMTCSERKKAKIKILWKFNFP